MKRPISFTLLGLYLGWMAMTGFLHAIGFGHEPLPYGGPDGLSLLPAVFAAVAAEALWRCRPWCVRATFAYFAAVCLVPLVATAAAGGSMPSEMASSILTTVFIFAFPVLYVSHRASRLFAQKPARIPVPAPRP